MGDSAVQMWRDFIDGGRSAMDMVKDLFKDFLANMAHLAITRPIMVSMGLVAPAAGNAGGLGGLGGGSGAGGLGNLLSLKSWASGAKTAMSTGSSWISGGLNSASGFFEGMGLTGLADGISQFGM